MAEKGEKIRVLHFAKLVSRNDFVDSVISYLDRDRFEPYIVTFQDTSLTLEPVFKERGITHINLNQRNARNLPKLVPALTKIIRKYRIQVVHAHLFEESIISGFLKILSPKVKFIIGRHYSDEIYLLHTGFKRAAWLRIEGFANNRVDRIIAGSQMVEDILLQQKVPRHKIARIPYGFDFSDHRYQKNTEEQTREIRQKHGIREGELMLVNVGRLFNLKGQDLLIEVFQNLQKKYPQIKLLIIGDGPDRARLEAKAKEMAVPNLSFTGWLKDAHTYIAAADIVVHPTLSEMFSQLMIETMASAKPLVINNVSAVPDVITDKVNGIICTHTYDSWYSALEYLINNHQVWNEIGRQAEHHVKNTYPIHKVIKDYEALYLDLNSKR